MFLKFTAFCRVLGYNEYVFGRGIEILFRCCTVTGVVGSVHGKRSKNEQDGQNNEKYGCSGRYFLFGATHGNTFLSFDNEVKTPQYNYNGKYVHCQ